MPARTKTAPAASSKKTPAARMSLAEAMSALEKAGSEQTRKTYRRHGAEEPMFGTSFATLKTLYKRIRTDHELALQLWETGNFDARNLAYKVVDPAQMKPADLDKWAKAPGARMCHGYVAYIAAEGPHGRAKAEEWLAAKEEWLRCAGWLLVAALANLDEGLPDGWFSSRLGEIEKKIHASPNGERDAMNQAVIAIGGRNAALRKTATAAAKRIGPVEVDHGDTACKDRDAIEYIDKMWAHATARKIESPAAAERARESMRTRC